MTNQHNIIKLRRGTAAEWAASEPQPGGEVLKLGEPGFEKDTFKLKIGDGETSWNSLPYIAGGVGGTDGPLKYTYGTDFSKTGSVSGVVSSMQIKPDWIDLFPTETGFTEDGETGNDFGFDTNGLWFIGDAQPSNESYPARTNFDIPSDSPCQIIYTVNHNQFCSDQGVCFFLNNVAPQWNWEPEPSRIAIQTNCPNPAIYGQSTSNESYTVLSDPNYYTFKVNYTPLSSTVTVRVYQGEDTNGSLLDTFSINERLPQGTPYRIGFAADQDNAPIKAYISNVFITYGATIETLTLSTTSNGVDFSEFYQLLIDNEQTSSIRITSVNNPNNFCILNASVPIVDILSFVFYTDPIVDQIALNIGDEYYVNIDIIGKTGLSTSIEDINLHNGGTQTAEVLKFSNNQYQSVITGPSPNPGDNATRIIIQGQNGGNGEGGDVYLWGGDSNQNGGDIKIYAGDADNEGSGYGGYVNIDGGYGDTQGGNVSISAGNSNNSGGNVYITAGTGTNNGIIKFNNPITFPDNTVKASASATIESITFDTTINTNAAIADIFDITLTDNTTLANPTNPVNGKTLRWRILQDGNGNRSVALGDKFNLPSSATSPLPWSTSPNKMDILAATYHAGRDKWDIVAFVPGY